MWHSILSNLKLSFSSIYIFTLCFFISFLHAHDVVLTAEKDYTVSPVEALNSINIDFTFLDHMGFLWVSSGSNIYRHDGTSSTLISGKHGFLPFDKLIKMIEDKANNKYFLFESRSYIGYLPFGKFEMEQISLPDKGLAIDIVPAQEKGISIMTADFSMSKVYDFNPQPRKLNYLFNHALRNVSKASKLLYVNDTYFVLNDAIMYIYDNSGTLITQHEIKIDSRSLYIDSYTGIISDLEGNVYFTTFNSGDIYKCSWVNHYAEITRLNLQSESSTIQGLWKDKKNHLIAAWKDKSGFTEKALIIDLANINDTQSISIPDRTLSTIVSSDFSRYFIISGYYGAKIIHRPLPFFKKLLAKTLSKDNYLEDGISIRGIIETEDDYLIVREVSNMYRISKKGKDIIPEYIIKPNGDTLLYRCVCNVIQHKQKIWFSSCTENDQDYLISYNPVTRKSKLISSPGRIQAFVIDSENEALILAISRENEISYVYSFDLNNSKFNLIEQSELTTYLKYTYVLKNEDYILFGTRSGIRVLNTNPAETVTIRYDLLVNAVQNLHITSINEIGERIFVGTMNNGLVIYDKGTHIIDQINKDDGLTAKGICSVIRTPDGQFWISTFNGLYVLNPELDIIHTFYESDGINHNEFNRFASYQKENQLFYGSINGVLEVDLEVYDQLENVLKPIYISSISFFDQSINTGVEKLYNGSQESIYLSPHQSNLKIKYITPGIWEEKIGLSVSRDQGKTWNDLNRDNTYDLSFIRPGDYSLITNMKKRLSSGNNSHLKQSIIIDQYFYKTLWFKLLLITLSFFAFLYYLYGKNKQKEKIQNIRSRIAADLHDDIGSILTGISSKAEVALLKSNNGNTKGDIHFFLKSSNKALELMRDTIWSVNPDNDSMKILVDRMKDYAFNTLNHKNIDIQYNIHLIDENKEVNPLWRKELYMIFKESITNILKHSQPSTVKVTVRQHSDGLIIQIFNDGRSENKGNGLGMGIKSMKDRASKIKGKLTVQATENGFSVDFKGPMIYQ
jgi:two-component sensor histidine kinase